MALQVCVWVGLSLSGASYVDAGFGLWDLWGLLHLVFGITGIILLGRLLTAVRPSSARALLLFVPCAVLLYLLSFATIFVYFPVNWSLLAMCGLWARFMKRIRPSREGTEGTACLAGRPAPERPTPLLQRFLAALCALSAGLVSFLLVSGLLFLLTISLVGDSLFYIERVGLVTLAPLAGLVAGSVVGNSVYRQLADGKTSRTTGATPTR